LGSRFCEKRWEAQGALMFNKNVLIIAAAMLAATSAAEADTYTYKYVGPNFIGMTDHLEITFTTSAPLPKSTSLLTTASANVISGNVNVVNASGAPHAGFPLPLSFWFQIHTNTAASATAPGIDSWYIWADVSTLSGVAPTMTGTDYQAYSMNTLAFIPGSDIPGAVGLVTWAYDYEQATINTFYASCNGVVGCTLAGNGQPYVGNYGGIIDPSLTSASNWTLTVTVTNPPPFPPVSLTGSIPNGMTFTPCSATLTATGGTPPLNWTATGRPTGLTISSGAGVVAATPTVAGSFTPTITVKDSNAQAASVTQTVVINASTQTGYPCVAPSGAKQFQNKGKITSVGNGYIVVGTIVVQTPSCARVDWNGANGFAAGEVAESEGYTYGGVNVAKIITIN
jgi:hypothetical protein